jgi:hypothetical protein
LRCSEAIGASLPPAEQREAMLEGLYKVSHRKIDEA